MFKRATKRARPHRPTKFFIVLAICIVVVIIVPVTAMAYAGFVPGVSSLLNVNQPVDLGVRYNTLDFKNFQSNTQSSAANFDKEPGFSQNLESISLGKKLVVFGINSKQFEVSQSELTAFINDLPWSGSPLSNAQIRLNKDGTFEFSGNVKSSYVADLVNTLYPSGNYDSWWQKLVLDMASHLDNPAVYAKASISSLNTTGGPNGGQLHFKPLAIKINQMDLTKYVSNMNELSVKTRASYGPGLEFSVSGLSISDAKLDYYGNFPANFETGDGDPSVICRNYHGGSLLLLNPQGGRIGTSPKYCY